MEGNKNGINPLSWAVAKEVLSHRWRNALAMLIVGFVIIYSSWFFFDGSKGTGLSEEYKNILNGLFSGYLVGIMAVCAYFLGWFQLLLRVCFKKGKDKWYFSEMRKFARIYLQPSIDFLTMLLPVLLVVYVNSGNVWMAIYSTVLFGFAWFLAGCLLVLLEKEWLYSSLKELPIPRKILAFFITGVYPLSLIFLIF